MAIKRTPSWAIVARLVVAIFVFIGGPTAQSRAAGNLECPEIGAGHVPDLIGDTTGAGLATTSSRADIVNEVNGAINRLQVADPNVSWTDVQNTLIAAYCRAVADAPGLTVAQMWRRMRQFDRLVEQQIAGDALPAGSLIIANVPLPPAVFHELRSQAAAVHLTTAQLMADILARAAGR
jgi:hypothetical protein